VCTITFRFKRPAQFICTPLNKRTNFTVVQSDKFYLSDSIRIGLFLIYNAGMDISFVNNFLSCLVGKKNGALIYFTFMLPCIVIDFFLNNQPDALIIPILFCYKTLHVPGIFSAHHQELSTVHSALISFMQV